MSSLSHLKVLDLTAHLSGPYCAMILADHGADVVKVERPDGGEDMRRTPPFVAGESAPFMLWNRNKRSIALNYKDAADLERFLALVRVADVVIENFRPGTATRLGISYEALSALNSRLIYCSISGFGQSGPYSPRGGFDLIACAMSGLMSVNGPAEGPPFRIPIPITDIAAGMNGAIGILTALAAREKTGCGQHVDTSLFETGLALGVYEAAGVFATGEVPQRLERRLRHHRRRQRYLLARGVRDSGMHASDRRFTFCQQPVARKKRRDSRRRTRTVLPRTAGRILVRAIRRGRHPGRPGIESCAGVVRSASRCTRHGRRDRALKRRQNENAGLAGEIIRDAGARFSCGADVGRAQ